MLMVPERGGGAVFCACAPTAITPTDAINARDDNKRFMIDPFTSSKLSTARLGQSLRSCIDRYLRPEIPSH